MSSLNFILFPFFILSTSFVNGGNSLNSILITVIIFSIFIYNFPIIYNNQIINKKLLISFFLFSAYLIIQIIPFPSSLIKFLSLSSYDLFNSLYKSYQWMTISLNPLLTLKYFFSFILGFFLIFYVPHFIKSKAELRYFWLGIIYIGIIHAIFGLLIYFFQINQISIYEKKFYLNSITGFFINRNNFSFFCVILFIMTIYFYNFSSKYFYAPKSKSIFNYLLSDLFLIRLVLIIFAVTIILTKSRAGNLTFFISLFMMFYLDYRTHKKWTFFSKTILTVIIIDILFLSYYLGSEELIQRVAISSFEGERTRWEIFSYGLSKFYDFSLMGYSLGNFSSLFRIDLFQGGQFYDHVHNDFIEYAGELGILGLFLFCILFFFYSKQYLSNKKSLKTLTDIHHMIIVVIIAVLVHGNFDFALHIPSNILLIFLIFGMGLTQLSRSIKKVI